MRYAVKTAPAPAGAANEFVMSDASVDRMGDVIEADGWKLKNFRQHPIALFNHDRDQVIGHWKNVRVEKGSLLGELVLADAGTSPLVDTVRALHEQKILRAVSVGFRPLKFEPLEEDGDPWGPTRFLEQELLECSLVAVPANPNALSTAKSLNVSRDQLRQVFCAPAIEHRAGVVTRSSGKPADTHPAKGKSMSTLSARIENARAQLTTMRDRLATLSDAEQLDDAGEAEATELATSIKAVDAQLSKDLEREAAIRGAVASAQVASTVAAPAVAAARSTINLPARPKASDLIVRSMACHFIAKATGHSLERVLSERYRDEIATGAILKAAMAPAMTTVPGWAQELVGTAIAEFMNLMPRTAIYPVLSNAGSKFTFGSNGIIKVPARSSTPKINGSFVGEGQPIPVRKLGLTSVTLTPKKMAVISEFTREMAAHSTPAIESVIRQAITEDTAEAIDTALIDTTAADAIRPAGLRNGVSGLTPSTATTTFDKMIADIKALIAAIVGVNGGRNLVLLCNPAQALALSWVTTPQGEFVFTGVDASGGQLRNLRVVSSTTVPATMLILVDAADFTSVTGDTPEFDVSDVATIHEEDTAPLPIVGGTAQPPVIGSVAAPVRSLWQTASIGVRMLLDMNWAMRRTGMVAWMTGVTW